MTIVFNFIAILAYLAGGGIIGASIKTPREQTKTSFVLLGMGLVMLGFIMDGVAFMTS